MNGNIGRLNLPMFFLFEVRSDINIDTTTIVINEVCRKLKELL